MGEAIYLEFLAFEAYLAGHELGQYLAENGPQWDSDFLNWVNKTFSSAGDACYDPTENM